MQRPMVQLGASQMRVSQRSYIVVLARMLHPVVYYPDYPVTRSLRSERATPTATTLEAAPGLVCASEYAISGYTSYYVQ
jgi:hypothetical protein